MNLKLSITVEAAWRGGTLDTVSNVAEFYLHENERIKGLYGLSSSESKPVKLTNGELIYVWAALTSSNRYVFHIEHNKRKLIGLEAETINSTKFGLFGPGVYMASTGRPINLFVRAAAKTPIYLATPSGTARIIPYLVYVRWGLKPMVLP